MSLKQYDFLKIIYCNLLQRTHIQHINDINTVFSGCNNRSAFFHPSLRNTKTSAFHTRCAGTIAQHTLVFAARL